MRMNENDERYRAALLRFIHSSANQSGFSYDSIALVTSIALTDFSFD